MSSASRLLACTAVLFTALARADIMAPPGLQPGDQFRLMFVTSFGHDATSLDIDVYDAFAEFSAIASGLTEYDGETVAWHVLGSTLFAAAHDRLSNSQIPIYNTAGEVLFDAANPIWGNALNPTRPLTSILTDQGTVYGGLVWTGTNVIGNPFTDYWLGGLGNGGSEVGFDVPTTGWLNFEVDVDATTLHPLYAFSDVVTVAANNGDGDGTDGGGGGTVTPVPEPDSLALLSSAAALVLLLKRPRPA
jgi:hypothetical protein